MIQPPLSSVELRMIQAVLRRHPEVTSATVFGSRAKGTHTERSDVDLAIEGDVSPLRAEAIAAELDDLPLPYRFDVLSLEHTPHETLREHIARVGICILRSTPATGLATATPEHDPAPTAPA